MKTLISIHPLAQHLAAYIRVKGKSHDGWTEPDYIDSIAVVAIGLFSDGRGGFPSAVPLTLDPTGEWVDVRTLEGFCGFNTEPRMRGVSVDSHARAMAAFPKVRAVPAPTVHPEPPGNDPERGFVVCPTCHQWTASVRGEACGDCHHRPVVVTIDYASHTFEAKLTLADDRVILNRDGHFGARGRWDDHHSRIEDCPGQLHLDETISEAVYDLLESRLKAAVAARRSPSGG